MSLRNLVRSQWWWAVVLVLWVFELLGIFYTLADFVLTIGVTLLVLVAKAVERLTRPDRTARKAARHSLQRDRIEKFEKKNKSYGLILAIILGLVLFSVLVYVLNILGAIIYFIIFYLLERYYERKNRMLYYMGYYALIVGIVLIVIVFIGAIFSLGIFSVSK